jgi:predicted metal-dependent hydrolase
LTRHYYCETLKMHVVAKYSPDIVVRENIDFGLDGDIPRYWYAGDPYKSRLFDSMQLTFPEGERFFMKSVGTFRKAIKDPVLAHQVKDFMRQEGAHGIAHTAYHDALRRQGLPVDQLLQENKAVLDGYSARFSREFNIALTSAFEHFTGLLAETFFSHEETTHGMDDRIRALMAWHAMEEMEHKSVAFDVMIEVGKVGYVTRSLALIRAMWRLRTIMFGYADRLLKADGYGWFARKTMFVKNLRWMFGKRGVLALPVGAFLGYFRPSFHPNDIKTIPGYYRWLANFEKSRDPVMALNSLFA